METYTIRFFRIAARFLGIARIDLYEVAEILRGLGYTITLRLPPRGFGASAVGSGPMAAKGNVVVDVNSDKMVVGVSSPVPEECIEEFMAVEKAIMDGIEALKEVYFYELLAELEVKCGRDPLKLLEEVSCQNAVVEELSRALGEQLFVFGYRLARRGTSPEESEWVDIEVMPSLSRPHSSLRMALVYRSRDREKVLGRARNIASLANAVRRLSS